MMFIIELLVKGLSSLLSWVESPGFLQMILTIKDALSRVLKSLVAIQSVGAPKVA